MSFKKYLNEMVDSKELLELVDSLHDAFRKSEQVTNTIINLIRKDDKLMDKVKLSIKNNFQDWPQNCKENLDECSVEQIYDLMTYVLRAYY
jgi:hypothetical protein